MYQRKKYFYKKFGGVKKMQRRFFVAKNFVQIDLICYNTSK